MDYSFNSVIAAKYGVEEAVFVHNIYWWIRKNQANGRHYHDGRSWTYNKMSAFAELFPFWSVKQVRRIIVNLKNAGALLIGNYNEDQMDRTQWYALSDEVLDVLNWEPCKCPNGQMEEPQTGTCTRATTIRTDSKHTDSKRYPPISPRQKQAEKLLELVDQSDLPFQAKVRLKEWLEYRKYALTEIGVKKILTICARNVGEYGEDAVCDLIDECISNAWKGIIWERLSKRPKNTPKRDYLAELLEEELHGT